MLKGCVVSQGSVGAALEAGALKEALQDAEPDQWRFNRLVKAIASAPANCLWRAGGKLIMSNPDRNQVRNNEQSVSERSE